VRRALDLPSDVGALYAPAHDTVIAPVLEQQGRLPDFDIERLQDLGLTGATVLDLGANLGYTTIKLAHLVGLREGRVIAVEPHPENLALLRANLRRNRIPNVRVIGAAAWRETGHVNLGECRDNTGDHRVGALLSERKVLRVPAVRLDDVIDEEVHFILADTQATEHVAFEGARGLVERCHPLIYTEFWPAGIRVFGDDPIEVLEGYRRFGYSVSVLDADLPDESNEAIVAEMDSRPAPFGGFGTIRLG
jgi:FkbM family methyltransferase